MDRRSFLLYGFKEYFKEFLIEAGEIKASENDYFSSVFSCYPLLSEAPYGLLVEAAENLGICPDNKSKLELAKEIFSREDVFDGANTETTK